MTERRCTRLLATIVFICFVYFLPRYGEWDQNSRFDLTLAIANHATLRIDHYVWNTGDTARSRGHIYSIQAPGQALSGVPLAWIVKGIASLSGAGRVASLAGYRPAPASTAIYFGALLYFESMLTAALPATLLVVLFFWFLGFYSSSLRHRLALSLAFGLATMIFPYAQMFYSHVPATALLFLAFVIIYIIGTGTPRGRWSQHLIQHPTRALLLAGLALGFAEVYEYPAGVIIALLLLYAAVRVGIARVPLLLAGMLPGALITGTYDYAVYGSPFLSGYSGHSSLWRSKLAGGIGGSTFPPHPAAVWGMSFSPFRGIFFLMPFLLLAPLGFRLWAARGERAEWMTCAAIAVTYFLVTAMSLFWQAGSTVGPRYLIPILPFLCVPIILVIDALDRIVWRLIAYCLFIVSGVLVWLETVANGGYPAQRYTDPLLQFSIPGFLHDHVALNLGSVVLGPLAGMSSRATLLLLPLLLAFWIWFVLRPRRREREQTVGRNVATVE